MSNEISINSIIVLNDRTGEKMIRFLISQKAEHENIVYHRNMNLPFHRIHIIKIFMQSVRTNHEDNFIVQDPTICLGYYSGRTKMLNVDRNICTADFETVFRKVEQEIDFHLYGKLCLRESLPMLPNQMRYAREIIRQVSQEDYDRFIIGFDTPDYDIFYFDIKIIPTGLRIIYTLERQPLEHGTEFILNFTDAHDALCERNMVKTLSYYGIRFPANMQSVRIGDDIIEGLLNVATLYARLYVLCKF